MTHENASSALPITSTDTERESFCRYSDISPCSGDSHYGNSAGTKYCILHFPGDKDEEKFNRAIEAKLEAEDYDFGRVWFPFDLDLSKHRFNNYISFYCAHFDAEVNLSSAIFEARAAFFSAEFNANADFSSASFNGLTDFNSVHFNSTTEFSNCNFNGHTNFTNCTFRKNVNFRQAVFNSQTLFKYERFRRKVDFSGASFNAEVKFDSMLLSREASFYDCTVKSSMKFDGGPEHDTGFRIRASLNFSELKAEKPERISFNTLRLRPHWFVGLDVTKLSFFNIEWAGSIDQDLKRLTAKVSKYYGISIAHPNSKKIQTARLILNLARRRLSVEDLALIVPRSKLQRRIINATIGAILGSNEIESRSGVGIFNQTPVPPAHHLLSVTCQQLATNAEENRRYEEASKFRYWSMDVLRRVRFSGFVPWELRWWYWVASGYGERALRALVVLAVLWVGYAFLYTRVGFVRWETKPVSRSDAFDTAKLERDAVGTPLELRQALIYSMYIMTLQKPEPRPATTWAHGLAITETILGPLQIGLLGLSIRRKFMR